MRAEDLFYRSSEAAVPFALLFYGRKGGLIINTIEPGGTMGGRETPLLFYGPAPMACGR